MLPRRVPFKFLHSRCCPSNCFTNCVGPRSNSRTGRLSSDCDPQRLSSAASHAARAAGTRPKSSAASTSLAGSVRTALSMAVQLSHVVDRIASVPRVDTLGAIVEATAIPQAKEEDFIRRSRSLFRKPSRTIRLQSFDATAVSFVVRFVAHKVTSIRWNHTTILYDHR